MQTKSWAVEYADDQTHNTEPSAACHLPN